MVITAADRRQLGRTGLPVSPVCIGTSGEFSGERVKRSVEESLTRLGLDRVRLMYLHDPERLRAKADRRGAELDAVAPGPGSWLS